MAFQVGRVKIEISDGEILFMRASPVQKEKSDMDRSRHIVQLCLFIHPHKSER